MNTINKRIKPLFSMIALLAFSVLPAMSLQALPTDLLDTWVLPQQSQSWFNGQYRYRVLAFWQKGPSIEYLELRIYPSDGVRSVLITGKVRGQGQATLVLQQQQEIRIVNEGRGFPTYFSHHVKPLASQKVHKYRLESGKTLELNGQETFNHYGASWAKARRNHDAFAAMDLTVIHFYLIQSQVPNFGSMKMMKNSNTEYTGLLSGQMILDFEARGLLGFGNSGLWFRLIDFQQLPHTLINGKCFGGFKSMEGFMQFFVYGEPVLKVDYSQVIMANGYAADGSFLVNFPGKSQVAIPVGRYGQ